MTSRQNKWIKKARRRLIGFFGGKCWHCGATEKLQFAHIAETELKGVGRGRHERYYDVLHNLDSYALLCEGSHRAFDAGIISLADFEKKCLSLQEIKRIVNVTILKCPG